MTITNRAIGEQINLATVLNTKLETPILQAEMGLDAQASATKQAVRWDEFSVKHNNDGTFKTGIIVSTDISNTAGITGSQIANETLTDAQVSDSAAILASKLAIQKMYKKTAISNPSATVDTFGASVDLLPATGYLSLNPLAFDIVFGGTFGAETVTADVTVTYSDATTATVTKTATAVGTISLTSTDLMTLAKDGVYINKMSVKSKSSIASTTATSTFNHYGFYL